MRRFKSEFNHVPKGFNHILTRSFFISAFVAASLFAVASASASGPSAGSQPAAAIPTALVSASDVHALLDQVERLVQQGQQQQLQIEEQQKELNEMRSALSATTSFGTPTSYSSSTNPAYALDNASVNLKLGGASVSVTASPQALPAAKDQTAPLYINIGNARFTPGGWADFTSIYRTVDVGSGLGTSFGSVPFNNMVTGGLSETRFTAQSSRLSLRADETVGRTKVYGYAEADFNGYQPQNAYVSTNADTFRLRVFFLNLNRGKWDVLGGQSWSLLTPNRIGLSPFLNEIYNTIHLDTNYQVGLTYARQPLVRAIYHFTPNVHLGLSVENPEQYVGSAVTFPTLFSNTEVDTNSTPTSSSAGGNTTTPNLHPDVILKLAADKQIAGHNYHIETAGLLTPIALDTLASVTKLPYTVKNEHEAGGVSVNGNYELFKGFHLITTAFWSDGGGRYIGGLGPAFAVAQYGSKSAPFTAQIIHAGSGIGGFEWQATKNTLIATEYSGAYFQRRYSTDPSTGTLVGYGYVGSANTNNRAIQEGTFASQTTVWKSAPYGALQLMTQSSYVTRAPWYVAAGAPKNAHTYMEYLDIRYVLP
jgi:hypothetical protein